jgi:rhodanese-related sulfurtransferase
MNITTEPTLQDFHIKGVKHITPLEAFSKLKDQDVLFVDVREPDEFAHERINDEDVVLQPMSTFVDNLDQLPGSKTLIILCRAGIRSTKVTNLLNYQGHEKAYNLDGGIQMWKKQGLPVTGIVSLNCGCGCNGCK